MNYFIPDWKQTGGKWKDERTLNIIKLFMENEIDYQLVLIHYLPFLRYKAMEHSIYPKNYWRIYDTLQNIQIQDGHPIALKELDLPEDAQQVYTPHGVLLLKNEEIRGEIVFNEFAFVNHVVDHFGDMPGYYIYFFDDRGFISSRQYITEQNYIGRIDYYNEFSEITLTEYFGNDERVVVSDQGNPDFDHREYPNMYALIAEVLRKKFKAFQSEKDSLVTVTEKEIMTLTNMLQKEHKIIRIFDDDQNISDFEQQSLVTMMEKSLCVVTDSEKKKNELEEFLENKASTPVKVVNIPLYTTDLTLGVSNSVPHLTIYWKANQSFEEMAVSQKLLIKKIIKDDKLALMIEVADEEMQEELEEAQRDIVDAYFSIDSLSEDFKNTATYLYAKRIKKLYKEQEKAVEQLKETEQWADLVAASEVYERIGFSVAPNLTQLKKNLHRARIYLDFNENSDIQTHALTVSAGIPMIIKTESDYLIDGKNGTVLKKVSDFNEVLDFYLYELDNWNNVLVENVQLIEEFGSAATMDKWRRIFYG
ncbi:accessory Sec system protein Asp1 [Enterococcus alishanensis]|uniref:Accessory Sec system protein Asp1 n=1 Tax=Enterococcus alishanensis TaxID=1303817 RepID=A0ABS6TDX4_9ENTE|nr:accessory Sec system protein Asp1 [Enterococcus alishanensis]MBV7391115.1 accessory Sec system protein Asp1 [Enterococcus alishanensis]